MTMTFTEVILAVLSPKNLFLIAAGVYSGIIVGAIPGLTVTMAVALLVSLTYGWPMVEATALMMGIYAGGVYGGSWSAILMNIPGAPAAVSTGFDGYPLAKRGEAGQAIGLATTQSFVGGLLGIAALAFGAPVVANFALGFGPQEYFLLTMFGMAILGYLSGTSLPRGILAAAFGVFFGLVGMDPVYGTGRFTFHNVYLLGGVHFIPILIGLFGLSEVFYQMKQDVQGEVTTTVGSVIPKFSMMVKNMWLTLRCAVIGVFIGALPGVGGDVAALTAYAHAKQTVRNPSRPFGEGAYEGVIAPETANNACIGGALIPMITLGIPGDAVTAVLLGAMYIHGLKPGPMVMLESRSFFWLVVASSFIANIFMVLLGLGTVGYCSRIIMVKKEILMPIVVLFSLLGSFVVENNIFHVIIAMVFGILGYFMKTLDIPVGPMVLGVILGPMADVSLRRALIIADESIPRLLWSFVTRPISLVLALALVWILLGETPLFRIMKSRLFPAAGGARG
ncbi:MAG: tripartite tricarboxylate transporter permease [Firmicutes bacterium]|nr:tripartite tricarboxylate transporter permease [Bacillota bacterium]